MKEINDGGSAFPMTGFLSQMEGEAASHYDNKPQYGMSLRDWFAGQALSGMCSREWHMESTVRVAFAVADAMIAARNKPTQ